MPSIHLSRLGRMEEVTMDIDTNKRAKPCRREPTAWVPEEHVITESYPVFPEHVVDYDDDQFGGQLNVSFLVNKACRDRAITRSRVIGGPTSEPTRQPFPFEQTPAYREIDPFLAAFGRQRGAAVYETPVAIPAEYPPHHRTAYPRSLLDL